MKLLDWLYDWLLILSYCWKRRKDFWEIGKKKAEKQALARLDRNYELKKTMDEILEKQKAEA
jgi:hypothetical protein